jgi:hypothetical protein
MLVYKMAEKRGRSIMGWILASVLLSPLFGILALLILGKKKSK